MGVQLAGLTDASDETARWPTSISLTFSLTRVQASCIRRRNRTRYPPVPETCACGEHLLPPAVVDSAALPQSGSMALSFVVLQ